MSYSVYICLIITAPSSSSELLKITDRNLYIKIKGL